jgi:hypothetical protein
MATIGSLMSRWQTWTFLHDCIDICFPLGSLKLKVIGYPGEMHVSHPRNNRIPHMYFGRAERLCDSQLFELRGGLPAR